MSPRARERPHLPSAGPVPNFREGYRTSRRAPGPRAESLRMLTYDLPTAKSPPKSLIATRCFLITAVSAGRGRQTRQVALRRVRSSGSNPDTHLRHANAVLTPAGTVRGATVRATVASISALSLTAVTADRRCLARQVLTLPAVWT